MKVVELEQGSPEWEQWRAEGIGASDAPSIMGVGFVTRAQLLQEKLSGRKRETNFAMRRGVRLEPAISHLFEQQTGIITKPCCVIHDDADWLRASLDGLTFLADAVLECKAPREGDHETALSGQVPKKYVPQVQHILFVTDCPVLYYASYSIAKRFGGPHQPSLVVVRVFPDEPYQSEMICDEEKFWLELQELKGQTCGQGQGGIS